MANITVKNIPNDLYQRLKLAAAANRRSINNEIIFMIERGLAPKKVSYDDIQARAEKIRELTANYSISDDELESWINEGRE